LPILSGLKQSSLSNIGVGFNSTKSGYNSSDNIKNYNYYTNKHENNNDNYNNNLYYNETNNNIYDDDESAYLVSPINTNDYSSKRTSMRNSNQSMNNKKVINFSNTYANLRISRTLTMALILLYFYIINIYIQYIYMYFI
jgi:hypothetical protein